MYGTIDAHMNICVDIYTDKYIQRDNDETFLREIRQDNKRYNRSEPVSQQETFTHSLQLYNKIDKCFTVP